MAEPDSSCRCCSLQLVISDWLCYQCHECPPVVLAIDFRLNLMSWKGRWLNVSTVCTGASWQSFSGCYLVFQLAWDGPSELLFAALVELYYRREMYVHIQQCFWSLTLLYMWNRCTWNQRWYRRANGLHISHLGINIEIRELHRFYKSNFPAIWRFALCRIRAMKIGRWMEQCHGCVGNRENWWKPIAVSPSCSLGIKLQPVFWKC